MEILFYTIIVGIGLLGCGFWLGRQGEDIIVSAAIHSFIQEMIKAKLINQKKLERYIMKKYGAELDAE